jgi:predicted SAM-dependent methyltransferase
MHSNAALELHQLSRSYVGRPIWERLRSDRPITSYTKVQAVVGGLLRNRWKGGIARSEYLNIGCGTNTLKSFVNLDYSWRPGVDVCWDLSRPLPFEKSSKQGIYTEHCLEHLPREVCERVLAECHDILRPGGVLRVAVPDAELCLRAYLAIREGSATSFPYLPEPCPDWTPMEEVNRIFRSHGHLYAYDFDTLRRLLCKAGFENIGQASFRQGRDPTLLVDSESRAAESMYVEAVR